MNRLQLIIVSSAIVAVVILFSLPKVLLNKEEKELENSASFDNVHSKEPKKEHGVVAISNKDNLEIKVIKENLQKADDYDKLKVLDSLSKVFNRNGQYDSSAYYYQSELSKRNDVASLMAIGDAAYKAYYFATDDEIAEDWAKVTQANYQRILDKSPEMMDVKARLAMTYTKSKNPMKAVLTLREVLEKDPNNEQALLNIGLLSVQSGQFEKAIERFKKLLTINKSNWLGTFYLGIAYNETGKKELAKECFTKVVSNEKEVQIKEAANQYLKQLSINP